MVKRFFCLILFSLFVNYIFAETGIRKDSIGNSQNTFRNALYAFDSMDYGKALKFAEDAILYRKQQIEYETITLNNSLSSPAVITAGDDITNILEILTERKEIDSINIINSYLKKMGNDFFNNSISNLLTFMESRSVFPEAQKLIGDIYKLEGEYEFAEKYYLEALNNSSVLDVYNDKYDILYSLAEISEFEKDFNNYEIRLLNILTEDDNLKNKSLLRSAINTIKGNNRQAVDKFFNLYRADSYMSLNAYIKLAEYYSSIEKYDKALEFSCLAVITSYTKITKILQSRNIDYKATSLEIFLQECSFYNDIVKWGSNNMVWQSFTSFARNCIYNGYTNFGIELLYILEKYLPDPYWQKDAVLILENIN